MQETYHIRGITASDFMMRHCGLDLDLDDLKRRFASHCPDYMRPLDPGSKSQAHEFCQNVILKVEPECRKSKGKCNDKVWKFVFTNNDHTHYVFIKAAQFVYTNTQYTMTLTVQQACLIAHETYAQLIKLSFQSGRILMTPLAGACINKDDIGILAKSLGLTEVDLLIRISQSIQHGGHHLANSDADIAICGWIALTRNVKDQSRAQNIVANVMKQYMNRGKVADPSRIAKIGLYTTGGIPPAFAYEKLLDLMNSKQRKFSAMRVAQATAQSALESTIFYPAGPSAKK